MSVTLIARKAGVSIATVSRVINRSRPVKPAVEARVRQAMAQLQFRASDVRRRITTSYRQTTIALVSIGQKRRGWLDTGIVASVVAELVKHAQEVQVDVMLAEMPDPSEIPAMLKSGQVAGAVVLISGQLGSAAALPLSQTLPVVRLLGGEAGMLDIDHISVDNSAVGCLAANYLAQQGVDEIGFVTFSPHWAITRLRYNGFLMAAMSAGRMPQSYLVAEDRSASFMYGVDPIVQATPSELVAEILRRRTGRLGLFVSRDEEVVWVHRYLGEMGAQVGREVVLVSCDHDLTRLSALIPRPASVDLGAGEIARRALRRLVTRIRHPGEPPIRILVRPTLGPET